MILIRIVGDNIKRADLGDAVFKVVVLAVLNEGAVGAREFRAINLAGIRQGSYESSRSIAKLIIATDLFIKSIKGNHGNNNCAHQREEMNEVHAINRAPNRAKQCVDLKKRNVQI